MILYLSVLAFLINYSNNVPYNYLQIDVLYQGPTSNLDYFNPYLILILRMFQLSIPYQHDETMYSTEFSDYLFIFGIYIVHR